MDVPLYREAEVGFTCVEFILRGCGFSCIRRGSRFMGCPGALQRPGAIRHAKGYAPLDCRWSQSGLL